MPITQNLHTHTFRCKHAAGDVEDYCQSALNHGLTVLGISDHTALPDNRWNHVRMEFSELLSYCRAIDTAREAYPELTILKGMECEYAPEYESYYRDLLLGELGFDYLVGAGHWFPYQGEWTFIWDGTTHAATLRAYADYMIASMESSLFTFMAHPDVFGNAYLVWDNECEACSRDMLQAAADLGVAMEINGYGFRKAKVETPEGMRRKYPLLPFWSLAAEYNIQVVVNSDAHRPEDIIASIPQGIALAQVCGLQTAELGELNIQAPQQACNAQTIQ